MGTSPGNFVSHCVSLAPAVSLQYQERHMVAFAKIIFLYQLFVLCVLGYNRKEQCLVYGKMRQTGLGSHKAEEFWLAVINC